jgi:hypothetical protein
MQKSPFIYGTTVSEKSFTDREDEIRKLTDNLLGGINTMIISPRRWGKSSLVEKVTDSIKARHPEVRIAMIDMFTINTEEEFLEKFAGEILKASSSKWQEWIKNSKKFFKGIVPVIQINVDHLNKFSVSFNWEEIRKHEEEILNLPETIAQQRGIKMIVCLDEFQTIGHFSGYESFERKLRAVWQRQKEVTYCIYGSKRHMMAEIFNKATKPFYRFGDIIMLEKIVRKKWIKYICDSFSQTGKMIGSEEAGIITDLMNCHSWYVQQLSHYTWNITQKQATRNEVFKALNELINANMPFYQKEMEILSKTQLNLLKAVANGEKQFTSGRVMNKYRLGTPHNVSKNKAILVNNDVIGEDGGTYYFLDPAFALWFRKSFLNEPYNDL